MEINDTLNILNLTQAEITALGSVDAGTIVYNSTTNALETYNGTGWIPSGGGGGHNPYITEQTIYPYQILGGQEGASSGLQVLNNATYLNPFMFQQDVNLKSLSIADIASTVYNNDAYMGVYKLISKSFQTPQWYYRFDLEHTIAQTFDLSISGLQEITLSTPYTFTAGEVYGIIIVADNAASWQTSQIVGRYNFQGNTFLGKEVRSLYTSSSQAYNPPTFTPSTGLPSSLYFYEQTTGYYTRDLLIINIQNA